MAATTASGAAWAITDLDGRIEAASSAARELMRFERLRRGDNLLLLFPFHERAVAFDIEAAGTGWPVERTVPLTVALQPFTLRYRISRLLSAQRAGLFWQLTVEPAVERPH